MKKPKTKIKEIDLQKDIVSWLLYQGHFVWRSNTGVFFLKNKQGKTRMFRSGIKGLSDIIGLLRNGQFVAIECKVGYNKLTKDQEEFLEKVRYLGGIGLCAKSLDSVIACLKDL